MKSKIVFITAILFLINLKANAQDLHLSQLQNTPLLHNPSFAGKAGGDIRAIVNYRTQWGSVTSSPFQTFGANFDMRFKEDLNGSYLAGGVSMYSDVAGSSKMRSTAVNFTLAAHVKINNKNYFSGGLQGGFIQRSIDKDDLRFDNQFEGTGHNPALNSYEDLSNVSEISPTISGGISYMWSDLFDQTNEGNTKINVGLAVHHYNEPRYYKLTQEDLSMKYILSLNGSFGLNSSPWVIQPAAYLALQNKATDIVFGSLVNYSLDGNAQNTVLGENAAVGFGVYYRVNDAIIPTVQLQWNSFVLGMSYDINASQLTQASNGRGGFEISIKYISKNSVFGNKSKTRFY